MALSLYDTWTRSLREFAPLSGNEVGVYCCGPTVYNFAHIGNLRTYVNEDLLRRSLEFNKYIVKHVVNITDVGHLVSDADDGEDRMEKGSRRTGKTAWQIAEEYTAAFQADIARLNIKDPSVWCKATDHIAEQIDTVKLIETKGFTYRTSDGIYFDTSKDPEYGFLARLDIEGLQAGARVELGEKRNPTDFALWKFSPKGEQRQMEWESPWGVGFPGWHIECSAMSSKYLGNYFDIHCGGKDHIPIHHTNEIAQTRAAYNTRLANFWLHGFWLEVDGEKMSKSKDEFLRLQVLMEKGYDPLAFRYLCLGAHYRKDLQFHWELLDSAATALTRLRTMYYGWPKGGTPDAASVEKFTAFVNDDLNIPRALALAWDVGRSGLPEAARRATFDVFDAVLGLGLSTWEPPREEVPAHILKLVEDRQTARTEKRWADADVARNALLVAGWEVKDSPQGPQISRKK
jgi:cysteinyl-tRNA synthetase